MDEEEEISVVEVDGVVDVDVVDSIEDEVDIVEVDEENLDVDEVDLEEVEEIDMEIKDDLVILEAMVLRIALKIVVQRELTEP